MRTFVDEQGRGWVATAHEEDTPRHHGRWYLVFHPAEAETPRLPALDVRWQTRATAERTIRTMSELELLRRLTSVMLRAGLADPAGPGRIPDFARNVNAG
jgi:hypothetical protein